MDDVNHTTEEKAKIALSTDFLTAFSALPRQVQGKVTEFINKFRGNPQSPGIRYEKLKDNRDQKICSVRIDDTYWGIVVRQKETGVYLLLWVDHHDAAYAWAKNKKCSVNHQNGAIQVYDMVQEALPSDTAPGVGAVSESGAASLFGQVTDAELAALGVPEEQIPFIRSMKNVEEYFAQKECLSPDVYEALNWIAEGGCTASEVLELLSAERGGSGLTHNGDESDNLAEALHSPETLKSFVVVDGEDELRRIMAEPLEKWRVFLHPTQRRIASRTYSGPARVLGSAGTGKTVVAMHRAKHLVSGLGERERIFFTTFTANLAADIRENLRKICTSAEMGRMDILHLDAWVVRYLREHGYQAEVLYGNDLSKLWEEAAAESGCPLEFPVSFYEEEWNHVAAPQEAFTLAKYVQAVRTGRGVRLDRKKRMQVWQVFETFQNLMKERNVRDINTAMYECRLIAEKAPYETRYRHIIVDEGQDFSGNALRLLRAIAGGEHENDLFIVGDAHQRIYRNKAVMSQCGIQIRGRSSILKINYRTTEETRRTAVALLNGVSFDDLDNGTDNDSRCQSLTHGPAPQIVTYANADEEFEGLFREIQRLLDSGIRMRDICVTARTGPLVNQYITKFSQRGIRCYEIKRSKPDDRYLDGIRFATMHRVKGLEFQYMFVVSVNQRIVPLASAVNQTDLVSREESLTAEKCLLYVALTRAQKGAWVSGYGRLSEFLNRISVVELSTSAH